jgi:hypothetical protein
VAQAAPLPPLAAPAGSATPTATGGSNTLFGLTLPVGANCPDTGTVGYRWHTFIAPISVDVASLTWNGSGAPVGSALARNLFDDGGAGVRNQFPVGSPVVGAISGIPANLQLSGGGVFGPGTYAPGVYQVGIACAFADAGGVNRTEKFYASRITITTNTAPSGGGAQVNFAIGAVPDAPVLTTSSYNAATTTATVNFTSTASVPATTGFTATLVPVGGATPIAPIAVPAGATSFNVPGVALGSSYTVTLVANNSTGPSAASNSLTIAGAVAGTISVTAPDAFEGNAFTISWFAPTFPGGATPPAPTSYDVAIPGRPTITGVTGLSTSVPAGLAIGSYTATVTANYASAGVVASGSDGFAITPNTLVIQKITVTRPPGALILTQRCGVFGPLAAFTGVDSFPGFPVRPATGTPWTGTLAALAASADQVGTSPDINPTLPGVQDDPEFANYPEPSPTTYPTECGLSMGTARFVSGGALAGQFYTATGRLNQVTVLDTRDTDTGWIARGDIADTFAGSTGNTFSGDYLGWVPAVTSTSDPIVGSGGYDQIVTAGPSVAPGNNVTVANQATQIGMTENPILAESQVNQGLGIASMDARMNLLIPASADAADYSANLSLTVVPRP